MAKRRKDGRRMPEPWTCPKCHQTFKQQGRHARSCPGKPPGLGARTPKEPVESIQSKVRRKRAQESPKLEGPVVSLNGYEARVASFEAAAQDMVSMIRDMMTEINIYKRDSQELQETKQKLSAMFGGPTVPR